jgi:cytochrome c oxidase subunit 3
MPAELLEQRAPGLLAGDSGRPPREGGGDGGPDRRGEGATPGVFGDTERVGLWAFLATVTMLFVGFTSALLLRRASPDWQPLPVPSLLYASSAALVLSSVLLGIARRRLLGWDLAASQSWLLASGLLGLAFVAAQLGAWRQLAAQGVFLSSNPSSSFFYVLTGIHIVHLLGGLGWWSVVALKLRRMAFAPGEDGLGLFATYWHYLGALWIYLLLLMFWL